MYYDNDLMVEALQALVVRSGYFRGQLLFKGEKTTSVFWDLFDNRDALSHGERVFMEVLLDFWNGGPILILPSSITWTIRSGI